MTNNEFNLRVQALIEAVGQRDVSAAFTLGEIYREGEVTQQDLSKALHWAPTISLGYFG